MRAAGISGPCFVSLGDSTKLNKFLQNNPKIDKNSILVDGYDFSAYKAVGFQSLYDDKNLTIKGAKSMKAPMLSAKEWFDYLRSVGSLVPSDKPLSAGIPEGVRRLGGTFAIDGNSVVYAYEDGVPGDHPDPSDVLKVLGLDVQK
mmetsp:Transcript_1269/g.1336  ORF Transcript_1269/g.1336 Transcript_1269/m.1336 type:complete len:145 (-) Transcript_1269:648-1082(-)